MAHVIAKVGALASVAVLTAGLAGGAAAAPNPAADPGQHVAMRAQEHLGQRADAPKVTCMHDGTEMTFETFGAMVQHMQGHHG